MIRRTLLLSLILFVSLLVRLYKLDNPVADWHSWRQADTAAVARNFYQEGFNPFLPKGDDMSPVSETGLINPQRYRLVEFPIYPTLVYLGYLINHGVDERIARLINICFSLGSLVFVYLIAKRYFGEITGLVSGLLYGLLPFNIYFSRAILPEPSLVFFCLGMIWFLIKGNYWWVIFSALALLTKPTAIFYLLPGLLLSPRNKRIWLLAGLSLIPLVLWRVWIAQHPEGIPASNWLLNGTGIRWRPAFFRWIIGDRLGREILSVTGFFLFGLGIIYQPKDDRSWFLQLLALSMLLYLLIFATGNVQHDYYQYLIVPVLVIFVAQGFAALIKGSRDFIPRLWTIPLGVFCLILTVYLSWLEVRGLYQINNWLIVNAGREADKILPKNAIVVAPYHGDSAFLYQTNRRGWAGVPLPLDELRDRYGASYYISVNYDAKTNWVIRKYELLVKTPDYLIADLTKINPGFNEKIDPEPAQ